jgi:SPP1 gp7 family putative phage head morphogenesis protein
VAEIPSASKPYFSIFPQGNMHAGLIYVYPEDMIYFKDPDISNPYLRGIGRANALGDDIEVDEQMVKYSKRFFFNGAIPSAVGMAPGADEAVVNRLEESWNQKYGGTANAHKIAFLNWDAKIQLLKESNKDLEFIESRRYIRDESNQFFNIPPELMGILENSNRSTITAAYYLYSKNVLRKRLKFIADVLNAQLVPDFDNNVYIEYDEVVPDDEEFLLKKSTEGLKYGALSVNQWLRTNGFEDLGDKGEILYVPLNMIPVPLSDNAVQVNMEPQQTELPEKTVKKKLIPEQKNQMWQIIDKAAVKNERPFINALKRYFQDQQDKINKSLEKSVKQATDEPDELLDWDEEETLLIAILTPLWLESIKEGFNTINILFEFGLSEDFMQPKFLEWINQFGAEQVKDINDTTKEKLRKTLSDGIANGESIPKLRDRVSTVMTEAKTSRATKISRTETHNTVSYGTHETYKAANVQQREWKTTMDGRERDSHGAIDGEIRGIDQPFSNGLMHPGDASGPPEEIINCRCVELPILSE